MLQENIPAKHKFFMQDMKAGDEVIMYGVLVGKTQADVPKGSRIATENVKHASEPYDYRSMKLIGLLLTFLHSETGLSMVSQK
jgi:altronate hydrolase